MLCKGLASLKNLCLSSAREDIISFLTTTFSEIVWLFANKTVPSRDTANFFFIVQ
jgi:hypothetical protein